VTLDRPAAEAKSVLASIPGVTAVTPIDEEGGHRRLALTVEDARAAAPAAARAIAERGWNLFGLEPERRDLEALFRAISEAGTAADLQTAQGAAHV
jgi:ABC-2 type transport system ATP-binding protein